MVNPYLVKSCKNCLISYLIFLQHKEDSFLNEQIIYTIEFYLRKTSKIWQKFKLQLSIAYLVLIWRNMRKILHLNIFYAIHLNLNM